MSGFRLVAIKTGKKEKSSSTINGKTITLNPLKILKANTIYSFNSQITFNSDDLIDVTIFDSGINLYDTVIGKKKLPININAIVGKNGSGKSSLIELLYWANYNIGAALGILIKEKTGRKYMPYKIVDLEILYAINKNDFIRLIVKDSIVQKQYLKVENNELVPISIPSKITDRIELHDFFYSIVINYSQHALNSNEVGNWIIPLFHKNDGYQTPIVINPMRTEGNIDINRENNLLKSRLIANLIEIVDEDNIENSLRNVIDGKYATKLVLKFKKKQYIKTEIDDCEITTKIINALSKYFNCHLTIEKLNEDEFLNLCFVELKLKLNKISYKYRPFYRYRRKEDGTFKDVDAFMRKIYKSNSHIIFKVKGIILYMKYFDLIFGNDAADWNNTVKLDIQKLSERIATIKEDYWINTSMFVPPKLFDVEIILNDDLSMDSLSSGEKQRIHSISSIVYHIINLNSVNKIKKSAKLEEEYFGYRYINLILDEIELYYHPEWQRLYFSELLTYLSRINPGNIDEIDGLNIMVLTHSPFILSDIPQEKIIRIDEGIPKSMGIKTFGANIYELLDSSFFMKSTNGEFANSKINEILELYYKYKLAKNKDQKDILEAEFRENEELFNFVISNIGEDVIRNVLKNHFDYLKDAFNHLKKFNSL